MPQKPVHVSGWFAADNPGDPGAHPEHPIVIPPESGKPPVDSGAHPEHPIVNPPVIWGPTDPRPTPPIVIPPHPSLPPQPGHPAHPIVLPPETGGPIYVQGTPDKPITTSPGTLQPPLPAGSVPMGTVALAVNVVGVEGTRWLTYATEAQPK